MDAHLKDNEDSHWKLEISYKLDNLKRKREEDQKEIRKLRKVVKELENELFGFPKYP